MASKKKKESKKELKKKKKLAQQEQLKLKQEKSIQKKAGLRNILTILGILLITFATFSPSLNNKFVNWDDDKNFAENELVTTIDKDNFWINTAQIFKSDVIGGYNPLTIWSFALEKRMFGLDKHWVWHLNNILLHLVCVFFVFWIGLRLKLGYAGSIILTLLFAIHPMRVESVAWITERKDVLFGAFYLAAMFYYIKGKQEGFRKKDIAIIGICFVLSLLSKIQAVIFPISMILVDYYLSKSSKITLKSIFNKTPLLIGSLIIGLVNIYFLKNQGSITQQEYHGIDRLFIGSYGLTTYYIKSLIPFRLSPLYPYPSSLGWQFYASIITLIGSFGLLAWAYIKKWKVLFFGLGFFLANIILLLQIVGAGQGFLADRFTYIAYFGLFFLFAYGLNGLINKKPQLKLVILGVVGAIMIGYGYMNFKQNKIWENSGTLWTHVLQYYKFSTLPWGNRANYYRDIGQTQQALHDYNRVIRLKPDGSRAYNSLARLYFNFTERDSLLKALHNYNKAIEIDPTDVEYHVNRGATYAKMGDLNNALINLNQAEKIDASFKNIYLNRSIIYNFQNEYVKALADIDMYISMNQNVNLPDMYYEKARLHNVMSDFQSGFVALNKALSMQQKGIYYFERAKCYYMQNNLPLAQQDIRKAQSLGYAGDQVVIDKIFKQ